MSDLISRQSAIDATELLIKDLRKDTVDVMNFGHNYNHGVADAIATIKHLPSAERWIPVTERLPEQEGQYLVSCGTDYGIEVGRLYIDEDGERYFGCDWNDPDDIEAWMPLPEPYKRGEWKNERT